jgi:hypothetical protein
MYLQILGCGVPFDQLDDAFNDVSDDGLLNKKIQSNLVIKQTVTKQKKNNCINRSFDPLTLMFHTVICFVGLILKLR